MFARLLKSDNLSFVKIEVAPITWTIGLMSAVVSLLPELAQLVQFDATAIGHGQIWRVLTGHLTHWNFDHTFWDLSVFLVLGSICELRGRRGTLACVVGTAMAASCYLIFALPEISTYRGLSGIDSGLFSLLCFRMYAEASRNGNQAMRRLIAGLAACLLFKLTFELVSGRTVFVDQSQAGFIPIVGAHILGAITGVLIGAAEIQRSRRRSPALA